MNKRIYLLVAASFISILLASCASGGPDFASVKASGALTPKAGKGMVLIYRSKGLAASGTKPYIFVNQRQMPSRLARGGFYSYEAVPGPLHLAHSFAEGESTAQTKRNAVIGGIVSAGILGAALASPLAIPMDIEAHRKVAITVQVQPGQTHYIVMGRLDRPLSEVPNDEVEDAKAELTECHWLNPR